MLPDDTGGKLGLSDMRLVDYFAGSHEFFPLRLGVLIACEGRFALVGVESREAFLFGRAEGVLFL